MLTELGDLLVGVATLIGTLGSTWVLVRRDRQAARSTADTAAGTAAASAVSKLAAALADGQITPDEMDDIRADLPLRRARMQTADRVHALVDEATDEGVLIAQAHDHRHLRRRAAAAVVLVLTVLGGGTYAVARIADAEARIDRLQQQTTDNNATESATTVHLVDLLDDRTPTNPARR